MGSEDSEDYETELMSWYDKAQAQLLALSQPISGYSSTSRGIWAISGTTVGRNSRSGQLQRARNLPQTPAPDRDPGPSIWPQRPDRRSDCSEEEDPSPSNAQGGILDMFAARTDFGEG